MPKVPGIIQSYIILIPSIFSLRRSKITCPDCPNVAAAGRGGFVPPAPIEESIASRMRKTEDPSLNRSALAAEKTYLSSTIVPNAADRNGPPQSICAVTFLDQVHRRRALLAAYPKPSPVTAGFWDSLFFAAQSASRLSKSALAFCKSVVSKPSVNCP